MSLGHLTPIANHLWQSTLFAGMVLLLTLAMRKNRAQARYLMWLAASLKFLLPFSLLMALGSQVEWRSAPPLTPRVAMAAEQVSQAFAPLNFVEQTTSEPGITNAAGAAMVLAIWFCGFVTVVSLWWVKWRKLNATLRAATPLAMDAPIPVKSTSALLKPGVFGIFRPVLLLPEGIVGRLSPAQFRAILAHELCHVRRRDNLAAALHMAVEAIFWFHPLVWWIGAKLLEERERACDEEVLRLGSEPAVYAESILNVCKFYMASPLACASGVTGANLKERIEAIMANRAAAGMSLGRKLLLAAVGIAAVASPILIGTLTAPHARSQSKPDTLTFEVASIKPSDPSAHGVNIQLLPGGGLKTENVSLKRLIGVAYQLLPLQISGGPGWLNSEAFDIIAKASPAGDGADLHQMNDVQRRTVEQQVRERLRMLLAERFRLQIRFETKEMPVYALVLAKNGPKLKKSTAGNAGPQRINIRRGELSGEGISMQLLANNLSNQLQRPVLERTGLQGNFDFRLEFDPALSAGASDGSGSSGVAPDVSGPSLFTALQEQLGLKLEATKGPVEILVIERAEKPSAN